MGKLSKKVSAFLTLYWRQWYSGCYNNIDDRIFMRSRANIRIASLFLRRPLFRRKIFDAKFLGCSSTLLLLPIFLPTFLKTHPSKFFLNTWQSINFVSFSQTKIATNLSANQIFFSRGKVGKGWRSHQKNYLLGVLYKFRRFMTQKRSPTQRKDLNATGNQVVDESKSHKNVIKCLFFLFGLLLKNIS